MRSWRGWVLPALYLAALAAVRAGVLDERDPYWQVRAGVENLAGQPLSRPDAWSWDPVANLFTQTSPAWNDVLALGWRVAGFAGFFAVGFTSLLAYGLVTLALSCRLGARPLPALFGILPVLLLALPMLSPRATLVAQTLFLAGLLAADWARPLVGRAPTWAAAGLTLGGGFALAWAGSWVHLSWFLLAAAFWACVVLLLLATPQITWRVRAVLAGSAAVGLGAGAVAGPYGLRAWEISRAVQEACQGVILEWLGALAPGLWQRWLPTVLVALGGAGLGLAWMARHWRDRMGDRRVGLVGALLLLAAPTAVGGFLAIRFVGVSLLALSPLAALAVTGLADRAHRRAGAERPSGLFRYERVRFWSNGRPWRIVLSLVLVLVLPVALLAASRLGRPDAEADAAERLPQECRLFSDPAAAAPVILLRPDVRVWMDSRADYWGHQRNVEAIETLASGDPTRPGVAGATCAMLSPGGDLGTGSMATALDADPAWERVWSARGVTVWVRTS